MVDVRSDVGDARLSETKSVKSGRLRGVFLAAGFLVIAGLLAYFLMPHPIPEKRSKPVPVLIATVVSRDMPIQMKSIGSVTPINSVAVKSHVAGQILETHFKEGQPVKKGQLLFTIDPRPLQSAVMAARAEVLNKEALIAQAEAAIAKGQALIDQARANKDKSAAIAANSAVEEKRYAFLSKQGAVSTEQYDQVRTNNVSAKATVKFDEAGIGDAKAMLKANKASLLSAKAQLEAAKAALQNAQIQLQYTSITSPIDGIAGNVQILAGNLVRQDLDTLVTVNQIDPIYVSLTVPEHEFADLRRYASQSKIQADAYQSGGGKIASAGHLVFANNLVDPATGTVLLKVEFHNTAQKLWPGQFVNIVMTLAVIPHAVIIPAQAVQTGQEGSFVWVLNADNKVQMQAVTIGQTIDGQSVVKTGLTAGQTVITDGQMQLAPNVTVNPSKIKGLK